MTSERNNDRQDRHDSRPQDDNKARPVETTRQEKSGNGKGQMMPQHTLRNQLIERASRCAADGEFHLASVLYEALDALQTSDAIMASAQNAWSTQRVREVPLLNVPMRDDDVYRICDAVNVVDNNANSCSKQLGHLGQHTYPTVGIARP